MRLKLMPNAADEASAIHSISVGWARIRMVRDFLRQAKFTDYPVDWIETGPWYARVFHLKGEDVDLVVDRIEKM